MNVLIARYDGTNREVYTNIDYILFEYQKENGINGSYWLVLYPKSKQEYNLPTHQNCLPVGIDVKEEYFTIQ